MRILITGASGFLGKHLLPLLASHDVLSLTRSSKELLINGSQQLIGDILCDGSWQAEIEQFSPDCCIHLAWHGLPDYSLANCRVNLDASLRLLQTLVKARVKRVVVAGSCWEYGRASGPVSEKLNPSACGNFAATKHDFRRILESVAHEAGIEYRWARIFFAYGPGQRTVALIPDLYRQCAMGKLLVLREPLAVQDFVYVGDVARGLKCLAECDGPSGIFNLGSGKPTRVSSIASMVASYFGMPTAFTASNDGPGFWADHSYTTAAFGWQPTIDIIEGVRQTLDVIEKQA